MTRLASAWQAWDWDVPTALWVAWMIFFASTFGVLEWLTSGATPLEGWEGNMLTNHWRPLVQEVDILWFVGAGAYLGVAIWGFWHFFIDGTDFAAVFNFGRR